MGLSEEWLDILACPGHDFQGHETGAIKADLDTLRKALEAAQDEIEARILASERDRELIRQLGVVVDHMAPAAYKAIMANGGANDDAPGDES